MSSSGSAPAKGIDVANEPHANSSPFLRRKPLITWPIYLTLTAVCLYRLAVFRPLPLDELPSARPILYAIFKWFVTFSGGRDIAYDRWHTLCFLAVLAVPTLALLNYPWRTKLLNSRDRLARIVSSPSVFWVFVAASLLICRFPTLLRNELNPDEGQFLAAADKLFYDHNFFRAVDCGTSGPLNIYPLMLPAIFGFSPDFVSARLIGLTALFLSTFLLYRSIELLSSDAVARTAILPVIGAFALFTSSELLHYSSEHIPMLLISLALYFSVQLLCNPDLYKRFMVFIGFIAGAAFFTKMQSVPIIAAMALVCLAYLFVNVPKWDIWRPILLTAIGPIALFVLNAILCEITGVWRDFWRTYVMANISYAMSDNTSLITQLGRLVGFIIGPIEVRLFLFVVFAISACYLLLRSRYDSGTTARLFTPLGLISLAIAAALVLPASDRSFIYPFAALFIMSMVPLCLLLLLYQHPLGTDPKRWFGLLALAGSAAAVYSIYKAHHGFVHYLLFLFIPLSAIVGWTSMRAADNDKGAADARFSGVPGRVLFVAVLVLATVTSDTFLWRSQDAHAFDVPVTVRAPEGDFIRTLTTRHGQIFVWGWDVHPYLASAHVSAIRDLNISNAFRSYNLMSSPPAFVPTPASERVSAFYANRMLRDLKANPPELFIDAIGPGSWFLNRREYFGFERFPEIAAFVKTRYIHIADFDTQRYYVRRDLAALPDAIFNRALPVKTCAPNAIRCSDVPTTLPVELPSIQIPLHARMDVEFMPFLTQIGPATILNNEAHPNSFHGFRLQHSVGDRYVVLLGAGDHWAISKDFFLPPRTSALVSVEFNGPAATVSSNGTQIDTLQLGRGFADSPGSIDVGSWIGGADPFTGKVQFFQVVDLDKQIGAAPALEKHSR